MKENSKKLILILAALLLVVVVLVYVVAGRSDGPEQIVDRTEPTVEILISNTEIPATESSAAAEPTQSEAVAEEVIPTPRAGLESTDPATVNLASGQIQLVEVFAFW